MGIEIDPDEVFCEENTRSFTDLIDWLKLGLKAASDKDWFLNLEVPGGEDVDILPNSPPPKAGTIFLIFTDVGRIERFEMLSRDKMNCVLARSNGNNGWPKMRMLRYETKFIGELPVFQGAEKGGSFHGYTSGHIVRIVMIEKRRQ